MLSSADPRKYARYGFVGMVAAGTLLVGLLMARGYYAPKVAKAEIKVVEMQTVVRTQNDEIKRLQAAGIAMQKAAEAALASARKQTADQRRTAEELRAAIAAGAYQSESCEAAAQWLGETWPVH